MSWRPLENPSPKTLYMRKWTAANPGYVERQKTYRKEYYAKNREKAIKNARDWELANPELAKERKRLHYEKNKARYFEEGKRRIAENIDRYREYQRRYQSGRRLKIAGTVVDFEAVIERCKNVCGICNKPITGKFHFDHIIPVAKGGQHITENIQQAHGRCNQMKNAKIGFVICETLP